MQKKVIQLEIKVSHWQPINPVVLQEKKRLTSGTTANFHAKVKSARTPVGSKVIQTKTLSLTRDCIVW